MTSSTPPPRRLPGGRARKAVAAMLPRSAQGRAPAAVPRELPVPGSAAHVAAGAPSAALVARGDAARPGAARVARRASARDPGAASSLRAETTGRDRSRAVRAARARDLPRAAETAGPGAVVDIGADIGLYALLAAACSDRRGARVRARRPSLSRWRVRRPRATACGWWSRSWRSAASQARRRSSSPTSSRQLQLARRGLSPELRAARRARRHPGRLLRPHGRHARRAEGGHRDDGARRPRRGRCHDRPAPRRGSSARSSTAGDRASSPRSWPRTATPGTT